MRSTGAGEAATVSAPVHALVTAVDALLVQAPADLPGPQALADATVLVAELERLRALVLTRLADVDTRQLHTLADAPSTGTWLTAQHSSLTRTELALARRLAAFPALATAVDTGAAVGRGRRACRRSARQGSGPTSTGRTGSSTDSPPHRPCRPSSSTASSAWSARPAAA